MKVGDPRQLQYIGDVDERTGRVRMSREAFRFIYDIFKRTGGDTDSVEAAQTAADNAAESAYYFKYSPSAVYTWNSDPSGTFGVGDTTQDIVVTVYDPDGTLAATITVRGTLTAASGLVTAVTEISQTGLTATVTAVGAGESTAKAEIEVELPSGTVLETAVSWVTFDLSTSAGTPATGGSK